MATQAKVTPNPNSDIEKIYAKYRSVLKGAKQGEVVTRFPPEPSGYLHIGHAKAASLNYHYAKMWGGKLLLRFDDTNPQKEKAEYTTSIKNDLNSLGIVPHQTSHTSDHFQLLADKCQWMIENGKAYADNTVKEKMQAERWDGIASAKREESVAENLRAWEQMKLGSTEGKTYCIRAKLSHNNLNKCLRDPVIYRCKDEPHPITGTTWKCYPNYDFCCPIIDSHEGVTHALRTNEYADRNDQYKWFIKAMNLRPVTLYDFSRLNFVNTTLSKRKLNWFVEEGLVEDWTDPRFPTVTGIMRRGMTITTIMEFMLDQGPTKSTVLMEWDKIWATNRKNIDPLAGKYTAVEKSKCCLLTLTDLPAEEVVTTHAVHAKNAGLGDKPVFHSNKLYIESDDVEAIKEGEKVTLMKLGNIMINSITKLDSGLYDVKATSMFSDTDYKTTTKITWLIANDSILTNVRFIEYGHLLTKQSLEEGDKMEDYVNKKSKIVTEGWAEPCVRNLQADTLIQFERRAYFRVDKRVQKGDDSDVTLECILIPDGKTKSMIASKTQMDAKDIAQGTGEDKKAKKADNKKADKLAAAGDGEKGPSKNDLKKAANKAKKDAAKAEHKTGGPPKDAPKGDGKKDAPKGDGKKDAPKGDGKKDAPKGDGKKDAPKGDGKKDAPKGDGKKDAPKGDGKKDAPKGNAKVVDAKPMDKFVLDSEAGLTAIEGHFKKASYCSGKDLPGKADADLLEAMEKVKFSPDMNSHPHMFAWWWGLSTFSAPARELWN